MKLLTRYNRYTITVMAVVFAFSGIISYWSIRQILIGELDESLLNEKGRIDEYISRYHQLPVTLIFNSEAIKFEPATTASTKLTLVTLTKTLQPAHTIILRQLLYTTHISGQNYLVTITDELEGTRHIILLVFATTLLTIFTLIVITLLVNILLMGRLWRPFYQILNEVKFFKINQPHRPRFPATPIDEFNFMIECLGIATTNAAENYRVLKEFTENASHEIQTPLAIIRSKLDLLVQHEGLNEQETASLRSAYGAIRKLSLINKDLLLITKIENHQFEQTEEMNLQQLMHGKIIEFQELWAIKQLELQTDLQPANIIASRELIDILINNILSNATKHNRANGKIIICLQSNSLEVANTGVGQPLDENLIFSRFYKAYNQADSNGLGLAIAQQICHISSINITYRYEDGLHIFNISW